MEIEDLVQVEHFCLYHNIDVSFVHSLSELGLVEITVIESKRYVYREHTSALEKLMRMHYDLGINMEGLDVVTHLLKRVTVLQEELRVLQNRLRLHENEESNMDSNK